MEELPTFRERLRWARCARGLSSRALGTEAGMSSAYVAMVERGEIETVKTDAAVALARVLDVPVGWLVAGEGPAPDIQPAA